jgi:hypothetical protein
MTIQTVRNARTALAILSIALVVYQKYLEREARRNANQMLRSALGGMW